MIHALLSFAISIVLGLMLHSIGLDRGRIAAKRLMLDDIEKWYNSIDYDDDWSRGYKCALRDVVISMRDDPNERSR